jgi:hypothetical protein
MFRKLKRVLISKAINNRVHAFTAFRSQNSTANISS